MQNTHLAAAKFTPQDLKKLTKSVHDMVMKEAFDTQRNNDSQKAVKSAWDKAEKMFIAAVKGKVETQKQADEAWQTVVEGFKEDLTDELYKSYKEYSDQAEDAKRENEEADEDEDSFDESDSLNSMADEVFDAYNAAKALMRDYDDAPYTVPAGKKASGTLRSKLIRLAHANPELRKDLLPLLASRKTATKKSASRAKKAAPQIFEDWLEMFLGAVADSCGLDESGGGHGQILGSIDGVAASLDFDRMGALKFNVTGLDYDDGDIEESGSIPFDKLKKMNPKAVGALVKEAANKLQKRK